MSAKKSTQRKTSTKETGKKTTKKAENAKGQSKTAGAPAKRQAGMSARRGDVIVIPSQRVGSPPREGEILRIIHGEVSISYEVRWADGHQSVLSPGAGNFTIITER